jgi:hypothetical protein
MSKPDPKPREVVDYHWLTLCDRHAMKEALVEMDAAGWEAAGPVFKCRGHFVQPLIRERLVFSSLND